MTILLDTNVLLQLTADSGEIGAPFKEDVESALEDGGAAVSTVTFVETTRLHHHGRIDLGHHPPSGAASGCDQDYRNSRSAARSPSSRSC